MHPGIRSSMEVPRKSACVYPKSSLEDGFEPRISPSESVKKIAPGEGVNGFANAGCERLDREL